MERTFLIAIRKARSMSQKDVADKAGISQTTYCNIESGKRNPSVKVAQKLGKVLGFDWTELFPNEYSLDKKQEDFRRIKVVTENENQLRAARELMTALELNVFELALLTSSLRVRPEFDLEYLERHYSSNRVSL